MKSSVLFCFNWYFHYRLWRMPIPFYNENDKEYLRCDINTHSFHIHWYQQKVWKLHVSQYARTKYLKKVKSHQIIWRCIHHNLSNFLSLHTAEKSTYMKSNSLACKCFISKIGFFGVQVYYYKFQTSDFNKDLPPSKTYIQKIN